MMIRKLFPLVGVMAVLAAGIFAQSTPKGPNNSVRLTAFEAELNKFLDAAYEEDDKANGITRPRIVEKPVAAVKSSVAVNIVEVERLAFNMVNEKRVENGLQPLTWNDNVAKTARVHSASMAEFQFFSHKGLDSKMVSDRADANGVGKWRSIGENIAFNRGYQDPVTLTVQLWLDSPGHRRNMLSPDWKESAIGVAVTEDGAYYFTQVFLVRK
ncbi:MAG: CAP domain-containing protein [Acidobacteria bacterium]|nr:CAP domain-containing protein [Acidobacteriota bacterium]